MRLLLDHFWANTMLLGGQTTEFHMYIYPFCPLRRTALVSAFRSFANLASHTLRRWGLRDYNRCLEERKVVGRKTRKSFFALFAAGISQVSTCHLNVWEACVGVHRAMAPIGDAKQATGEGKSRPVETGLTGRAATALQMQWMSTITGLDCRLDQLLDQITGLTFELNFTNPPAGLVTCLRLGCYKQKAAANNERRSSCHHACQLLSWEISVGWIMVIPARPHYVQGKHLMRNWIGALPTTYLYSRVKRVLGMLGCEVPRNRLVLIKQLHLLFIALL